MTSKHFNALELATVPPAKAGTPNPRSPGFGRFLAPPAVIMRIAGSVFVDVDEHVADLSYVLTNGHKIVVVEKHENKILARANCWINLARIDTRGFICDR